MNTQTATSTHNRWGWAHTLVTGATLLAAILRLWHLNSLPPLAWYDEIWFAIRARELLQTGHLVAHYGLTDTAGNAGLVYLTALARLLGIDGMGGARVAAAVGGILTVPLAYACFRELFRAEFNSRRNILAALVALIMAYLAFLVILGRVGMEPALALPVALFSVWQVMLGMRWGKLSHWIMAGVVSGLAQYNGPHARFVLPLLAFVVIDSLWLQGKAKSIPRNWWRGAAIFALAGILVCIPLILTFIEHPDWLTGRAASVSAGISLPDNILRVLGAFNLSGDLNARQNLPAQPMLDVVLGIGFVAGLVIALWRIRRRGVARILLVWLLLMAIPAVVTAEAPNFGRMIGVAPPVAALAVIGWDAIAAWVRARQWHAQIHADLRVIAAGLVLFSLGWNIELVFWRWAGSGLGEAFTTASVKTAEGLVERADEGQAVYVERLPEMLDEPAFTWLFVGTDIRRVDFRQCVPLIDDPAARTAYLILPEDDSAGPNLLDAYQSLDWSDAEILWGRTARTATATNGLDVNGPAAIFAPGISLRGVKIVPEGAIKPGQEIRLRLYWKIETDIPENLSMFIHLYAPDNTTVAPAAQADLAPCGDIYPSSAWHPGEVIAFTATIALPPDIPPGDYLMAAGWVSQSTGLRSLIISADESLPEQRALIGRVRIQP